MTIVFYAQVAQRTRTAGEVKEQIRRGTVRMSVKPRRETIMELEGIIATEKARRPDARTKSMRMNDALDEQEVAMLEEEVRLLREEEEIERAELERLQKEEDLVKVRVHRVMCGLCAVCACVCILYVCV